MRCSNSGRPPLLIPTYIQLQWLREISALQRWVFVLDMASEPGKKQLIGACMRSSGKLCAIRNCTKRKKVTPAQAEKKTPLLTHTGRQSALKNYVIQHRRWNFVRTGVPSFE
jgi:hypothetical protein